MNITTNIIIKHSALNGIAFKESIDLALVCAAFDQKVNLIFVDSGVTNLLNNRPNSLTNDKNHTAILKGLEFYDIENLLVEQESLALSQLNMGDLIPSIKMVNTNEINKLNLTADHVVIL